MSHECPATGCTRRVAPHMLMCKPDWYRVPKPLQDDVWAAAYYGAGTGSPEHWEAVNAKLAARQAAPDG